MGILDAFRRRRADGGPRPCAPGSKARWPSGGCAAGSRPGEHQLAGRLRRPAALARARELVVSNGYAANACEAFAANLVGDGIKPSSLIEDAGARPRAAALARLDRRGRRRRALTDFYGLQAMVAREMFVAGECFVGCAPRAPRTASGAAAAAAPAVGDAALREDRRPRRTAAASAAGSSSTDRPAARLPLPPPASRRQHRPGPGHGRAHPGDGAGAGERGAARLPADRRRPDQGLPHVAPAMVRLFLLDQYDDAELDRKKTAAMFAGFITKTAPEEALLGETQVADDGTRPPA